MTAVMDKQHSEQPKPGITPFLIITLVGLVVVRLSWDNRAGLGSAVWLPLALGAFFAAAGLMATVWTLRLAAQNRVPALPPAPAHFSGNFAPDFRRNLHKLYAALPSDNQEMTLEPDYAFWYNDEHSLELVLTQEGWLAFFVLHVAGCTAASASAHRAVADSPFAQHPVARELALKYADMPLSGIAWCTSDRLVVYPHDTAEEFTRFYANNLFAPAAAFDTWLPFYLKTGVMHETDS